MNRALLLDVDGVLVFQKGLFSQYLRRKYRLNPLLSHIFFRYLFVDCLEGRRDLIEILPIWLKLWRYPDMADNFLLEWFEYENHPNHELIAVVRQLKLEGWRVYLATNQEQHRVKYLLNTMCFTDFCDGEFSSSTIGVRKPNPAYFQKVSSLLSQTRIVFWDDSHANIKAAQAAGWEGHVFEDLEGFKAKMLKPD